MVISSLSRGTIAKPSFNQHRLSISWASSQRLEPTEFRACGPPLIWCCLAIMCAEAAKVGQRCPTDSPGPPRALEPQGLDNWALGRLGPKLTFNASKLYDQTGLAMLSTTSLIRSRMLAHGNRLLVAEQIMTLAFLYQDCRTI